MSKSPKQLAMKGLVEWVRRRLIREPGDDMSLERLKARTKLKKYQNSNWKIRWTQKCQMKYLTKSIFNETKRQKNKTLKNAIKISFEPESGPSSENSWIWIQTFQLLQTSLLKEIIITVHNEIEL